MMYLISSAVLVVSALLMWKQPVLTDSAEYLSRKNWRGFVSQMLATFGAMGIAKEARTDLGLPPFVQKPLLTGAFYLCIICLLAAVEGVLVLLLRRSEGQKTS
jgi:hypothetical protein